MNENTIIKVTNLIFKEHDILKGKKAIEEDLKANLEILYEYDDIKTEKKLNELIDMIPNRFDFVMDYVCDLMELDYKYIRL